MVKKATVKETPAESGINVPVDVIFLVDVTGSMGNYIREARQFMMSSMKDIERISSLLDIKYSLIVYRDHPPQDRSFSSKILVDVSDAAALNKGMTTRYFHADGGGDTPESGLDAVRDIEKLSLRPGSIRYAFLIGDAPLHGTDDNPCACGMTSAKAKTILEQHNVVLTGVNISSYSVTTQSFASIAQSVVLARSNNTVATVGAALEKVCKNIVWAVSTVLPILKEDKFKPLPEIATQCGSSISEVSSAIESLNLLELTATL